MEKIINLATNEKEKNLVKLAKQEAILELGDMFSKKCDNTFPLRLLRMSQILYGYKFVLKFYDNLK